MRIAYASDLHFEFTASRIPSLVELMDKDTDVLILAGDIQTHDKIVDGLLYIHNALPHIYIVYVTGNHEFFGATISKVEAKLKLALDSMLKYYTVEV